MDWEFPKLTQWTKDCVVIFGRLFLAQHRAKAFPLIKNTAIDIGFVKSSFRAYIMYLKRLYNSNRDDPIDASRKRLQAARQSRSLSRRRQVSSNNNSLYWVLMTLKLMRRRVALLKHHHFPNECIELVEDSLGVEGMSSEDSDGEIGTLRNFKIKRMSWRDPDLTFWLRRVDDLPLKNAQNFYLTHRWHSRRRVVSDMDSTRSKPLGGLPVNLYKHDWLMSLDARRRVRLNVDETPFELPRIDEFTNWYVNKSDFQWKVVSAVFSHSFVLPDKQLSRLILKDRSGIEFRRSEVRMTIALFATRPFIEGPSGHCRGSTDQ